MKKILIVLIIAVLVFGISFVVASILGNEGATTEVNNKNEVKNTIAKNEISNTIKAGSKNEINNNTVNNQIENTLQGNVIENQIENTVVENTETFTENVKTEEEKVKDIVIKDWGKDTDTITMDGINQNGEYIITVRDSSTTEALAYYTVDAKSGNFTRKDVY